MVVIDFVTVCVEVRLEPPCNGTSDAQKQQIDQGAPVTGERAPFAVPCARMDAMPTATGMSDGLPMNVTAQISNVTRPKASSTVVCYSPMMITTNGIWQGVNPLEFSLPLFILQMAVIVVTTRLLVLLLKPFRQPRVIAEILAGVVLGPSVMGQLETWATMVFPHRSLLTLETVAHLGLLYFLFMVGVEMDIDVIRRSGKKALSVAVAGMALPFCIGIATSFIFRHQVSRNVHQASFLLFLGVALSVTAFPVLARILAEIKLLNTELGRIAMSAAIVNDMCAWILLALAIAISEVNSTALSSLWVLLSGVLFVLFCFYAVRPGMWWLIRRIPEGEGVSDMQVSLILTGVMLAGVCTDAIGIHSVFGAFVYGLVIPSGPLGVALIEKLEDFVTGLLLPLFFAISGLRTNVRKIRDPITVGLLVLVFIMASFAKIMGTIIIAALYTMPFREGIALGFLMNTRGLVEMIVLNIGRDKEVLDDESFAVMVLVSVAMTTLVTPVVTGVYRPSRRLVGYKRRNLQRIRHDSELRMLACVHTTRNVPSVLSLLELSNPNKRSPIFIYALHLVELTGRASNMLAAAAASASKQSRSSSASSLPAVTEHIFNAFENYERHTGGVSIQTLAAVSPYQTMHEDVSVLAEDKHVSLIVVPFHKQQTVDGAMEPINPNIRGFNESLLSTSPCSVAILVDRGLSAAAARMASEHRVALFFFGGPDDREALAYAWRMVEHPGVTLTVVRFLPPDYKVRSASSTTYRSSAASDTDSRAITINPEGKSELEMDEDYLNEFRARNHGNDGISYSLKVVANSEETVTAIRTIDSNLHELYIVGRRPGEAGSPMTSALEEWMENPELGPIGDMLVSSDFSMTVSVLVVQQYVVAGAPTPAAPAPAASSDPVLQYVSNANQRPSAASGAYRTSAASSAANKRWSGSGTVGF
ncbi:cation/H(+) antiporter 15-like [Phragmites australis]|uniref:cation/H(+) antiporter 15-like n=1 Tax=Phragmites australis TaxID=29695 RepID=UPI002D79FAF1|nr:cation/H(+) antiporter 15-like [Phragmites australis]